jgi:hypothetical protein
MKKIIIFVLVVLTLSLAGCKTAGKAIQMPTDPSEAGFGIERTVNGNTVTLTIYEQALPSNEVLGIIELLPDGFNYVPDSSYLDFGYGQVNKAPLLADGGLITWLFANDAPSSFGETPVDDKIPITITYQTSATNPPNNQFIGKWGLFVLDTEDNIFVPNCVADCTGRVCGSDNCGGSCGVCQTGYGCSNGQCVSGGATIMDVLNIISQYLNGQATIMDLLNVINQYKAGLGV